MAQLAELMDKGSWDAEGSTSDITAAIPTKDSHSSHCSAASKVLELTIKPWLCTANGKDQSPVRARGAQTASLCSQPYLTFWHLFPEIQLMTSKPSDQPPLHWQGCGILFPVQGNTLIRYLLLSTRLRIFMQNINILSIGLADYLLFLVYRTSKAQLI